MSHEKSIEASLKNLNEEINQLRKELKSKTKIAELLSGALKEMRTETLVPKQKTELESQVKVQVNDGGKSI